MAVLSEAVGYQDIVLRRGADNHWGCRWEQSTDGVTFSPKNLTTGVCTLRLMSAAGVEWLSKTVEGGVDGLASCVVSKADLSAAAWADRKAGVWLLDWGSGGETVRIAEGAFALAL
ncbi:hypothetical protein [Leucobacter sp. OH1287]|uniref:hypothetical protein n=1 Tax=Leucobacter sp. OH1287 TaxID=2491049 RepID=UPI000F5EF1FE|nr:hypothetical protein [Leucobacter sp. OH1287]RRD61623.1 hypothetical protein EII30_02005 [Leucobacter sp. OH1287]